MGRFDWDEENGVPEGYDTLAEAQAAQAEYLSKPVE